MGDLSAPNDPRPRPAPAPLDPASVTDLFGIATSATAEGRAALARAVAADKVGAILGDALYAAARVAAVSAGGPLVGLGADYARELLEAAIRRDPGGVVVAAGKGLALTAEEASRRLLGPEPRL